MQSAHGLRSSIAAVVLMACTSPLQAVVTFEFTYFDPAGVGFNAPGSGDAFKFVLEDIAAEIGGFLDHTATVKIGVAPSEFDATGFSAAGGATFVDADLPGAFGFFDGEVIDRIVNGTPHPGTAGACGGVECDGAMVVDLGYSWSVDSSPEPTEIHFRSVMLHELTHILGYGSFITSSGTGFNGTTPDVYTKFDSFVTTSGGSPLIDPSGTPLFGPGIFPAVLASGTAFSGPHAIAAGGVGLAFSDPSHSDDPSDVMTPTSPTGFVNEFWSPKEFAVLMDLGYVFGTPLVGDLDSDGFVGITDLNIVLSAWNVLVPPGDPLADPSGDGFVGIEDLSIVLGNWNAGTPPVDSIVPEPASLAVCMVGIIALYRRRA